MAKDIVTKAEILGGEIDVRANFGQTVKVTVSPDPYMGDTEVTPSDQTQVLQTKKKFVQDDITVLPAPTEPLSTTSNGQFTPSSGKVGFSQVTVDVQPDLRPLSVSENGEYQPDGFDGYDSVVVDVPVPSGSMEITNNGTYNVANKESVNVAVEGQWIDYDDIPVTLPEEYQRVEYIESSGTQFIELPIGFYPTDKVWMKGSVNISNRADSFMVTPKTWNNSDNRFCMCGWSDAQTNYLSKSFSAGFGAFSTARTQFSASYENDGNIHRYLYKDRTFVLVDMGMTCVVSHVTFGAETANLKLFFGHNQNTAGKICYYIHKKADGRKLALYACYRKADGVIGMYDVENDVFYTNDGTGDFTKGQDI
jgi:hypothetical protein